MHLSLCPFARAFHGLAVALVLAAFLPHARAQSYAAIDLGTLGGPYTTPGGINDDGVIVGGSYPAVRSDRRVFIYRDGQMTDLGFLGVASDINSAGVIVGGFGSDSSLRPFRYSNGSMVDLGTLGGTEGVAFGINDSGQITGNTYIAGGPPPKKAGAESGLKSLPRPLCRYGVRESEASSPSSFGAGNRDAGAREPAR